MKDFLESLRIQTPAVRWAFIIAALAELAGFIGALALGATKTSPGWPFPPLAIMWLGMLITYGIYVLKLKKPRPRLIVWLPVMLFYGIMLGICLRWAIAGLGWK